MGAPVSDTYSATTGNKIYGGRTAPSDATLPTQTGSITASAITQTGFTISWPAGADNVAVAGYEYSLDGGASYTNAGNVLTKAITGLTAGTAYAVRVRAYDAAGNRSTPALSATVNTTAVADTVAPTLTGTLSASNLNASWFTLTSPAGSDNVGIAGYEYSINGGSTWVNAGNSLSRSVTGLTANTTYTVLLRAYDAAGNRSTPALSLEVTTGATDTLPTWVPEPGAFANISLNTMYDVRPSGWPTSDIAGPFSNWSGAVYAEDFSGLGAYVLHGSGHLANPTDPVWAGVWAFDLDARMWVGRNVPGAPLVNGTGVLPDPYYNAHWESVQSASLGHTNVPHTYDGLVYRSTPNGGSSQGDLIRVCFGGVTNVVHKFDLSSTTDPATRIIDNIGGNSYPMTAADVARNGFWYLSANGQGPLKFVSFSDWSITSYASVAYNTYGDNSMVYIPAPYDCLVGFGRADGANTVFDVYVCPIVGNVPQGFTKVTTSGSSPDGRSGGVWSTLLNCMVCYGAKGSTSVHKLGPPAGSLTAGTWAWTSETLTGVSGATPSRTTSADNGAWSRFIEVPAARCFIWCDSVTGPVQAWRLTGM